MHAKAALASPPVREDRNMRVLLLFTVISFALPLAGGCKTAEFAVTHPMTGLHFVARIEAHDPLPPAPPAERDSSKQEPASAATVSNPPSSALKKATHIPALEPVS
jgi:hypothetical protein